MSLQTLQATFQKYITQNTHEIDVSIANPPKGDKLERLAIYGEGYYFRLIEAACLDYRCLSFLIGEEFGDVFIDYINAHPSTYFTVHYIGFDLPQFLRKQFAEKPHLAEIAEFEIALNAAQDAKDIPIATLDHLRAIPPDDWAHLTFTFHPSFQILNFQWNVPDIWQGFLKGGPVDPVLSQTPICLTIWRKTFDAFYYVVDEREKWMLEQMLARKTFAEVCEGLTGWFDKEDEIAPYALNILLRWINEEMISSIQIKTQ